MDRDSNGDFYVGYLPKAPPRFGRAARWSTVALLLIAGDLATVLAVNQGMFASSSFEYGTIRSFEGVVRETPAPTLLVRRPGMTDRQAAVSRYLLTVAGKLGAEGEVASFDGRNVRLDGTLIYRDSETMIEVVRGSMQTAAAAPTPVVDRVVAVGTVTLVGEIVDSKCFLGVMKPGAEKPHRSCAARCISGGVPPMLLVRDAHGPARAMLLVGPNGESVHARVHAFVAEPVEITGELHRAGDAWILQADPATYRRLPS